MNHIYVACAIIEQDGKVLATRRSAAMSLPLKWEFPGGKIKDGETAADCLVRECREELGVSIAVGMPLSSTTHRYPAFTVTLYPFRCTITSGSITLHEHCELTWLFPQELDRLDWAEADLPVIKYYQQLVENDLGMCEHNPMTMDRTQKERDIVEGLKPVCICKGIKKRTILDRIRSGARTVEEVCKATGAGSGPCKGERCTQKLVELLEMHTHSQVNDERPSRAKPPGREGKQGKA